MSTTAPPRPGRLSTGSAPFARSIKVPQPRTPFIDPTTGGPSREWLYYLQALWDRTGAASGVAPYLPIGGGTLTGPLTLAGDPVSPNEAATKDYVDDNSGAGGIPEAPSNSLTYGRFNATWAQVLSLQFGGIVQGPLQLLQQPFLPNDAATKGYVDAAIAGGGDWVDAPSNGNAWGRMNATWVQVLPLAGGTLSGRLIVPANGTGIDDSPSLAFAEATTGFSRQSGAVLLLTLAGAPVFSWGTAFSVCASDLRLSNNRINLLADPIDPQDAATKAYVDANTGGIPDAPSNGSSYGRLNAAWSPVLPLSGGTLSGTLIVPSGTSPTQLGLGIGTSDVGLFYGGGYIYVAIQNVILAGFSQLGCGFATALSMSAQPITNMANPVNAQDAATKAYVDANAGGIADAPSDGSAYGRLNAAWSQVLPLAGGTLTGPLNLPNGTAAIPSLQFGADDGTGFSRSANALVMSVQGATVFATFFSAAQLFQPLYMLNNRILQVGDPTAPADALNLRTADARYLTSAALAPYAPLASPALTGIPTAPTPAGTDSSTTIATTAFVAGTYAPRVSPALAGNPTSPTATAGTNTNQIATTAFVHSAVAAGGIVDAPSDGTAYGRLNAAWSRVLPLTGGTLTGALTLAGDGATALAPVTVQQINNVVGQLLPLSGGTMTGPITLAANQIIDGKH